jgi:para-aminobenzoate synthetase/4-amino-4-deoxychorismate lyase
VTTEVPAPPVAARRPVLDGTPPEAIVRGLTATDGLVVLSGAWAGGGVIVARDPIRVSTSVDEVFGSEMTAEPGPATSLGGGWFGWLPYPGGGLAPWFGLYPNVVRYSATDGGWFDEALAGHVDDTELARRRRRAVALAAAAASRRGPAGYRMGPLRPDTSAARYTSAVERCVQRISAGDIYQANICLRLDAEFTGDVCGLFADLVAALEPAYAALVCARDIAVVSVSPELFLHRRGVEVASAPIKGTRPRTPGPDTAADDPAAARLARSEKDRAENVMIVDLVRNDLARVAATGTVRVPSLLRVEPHCGVWHLVSRVTAELRTGTGDDELLAATFPPGSVTGTPKLSALEVIDELETAPRGVYTGAVGYRSPAAGLELNVAIRTVTVDRALGRSSLGVGAGITAESIPSQEWRECLDKAAPLAAAAHTRLRSAEALRPPRTSNSIHETMLVLTGGVVDIDAHLHRLRRSIGQLWDATVPGDVRERVLAVGSTGSSAAALRLRACRTLQGPPRVDLRLSPTLRPLPAACQPGLRIRVARVDDGVGEHKTPNPELDALAARIGRGHILLVDRHGRCLQTQRGNLLVFRGRTLVTPPLDGRVMPGTTRRTVLELAGTNGFDVQVREVELAELAEADGAAVSGSLAGIEWIRRCPGRAWTAPAPAVIELAAALLVRWGVHGGPGASQ